MITYFKSFVPFLYSCLVVSRVRFKKIHIFFAQLIFAAETTHFAIYNRKNNPLFRIIIGVDN